MHAFTEHPKPEKRNQPTSTRCRLLLAFTNNSYHKPTWFINNPTHYAGLTRIFRITSLQHCARKKKERSWGSSCRFIFLRHILFASTDVFSWMPPKDDNGSAGEASSLCDRRKIQQPTWTTSAPGRESERRGALRVWAEPPIRKIMQATNHSVSW